MATRPSTVAPSETFLQNICRTCLGRISRKNSVSIFSTTAFYKGLLLQQLLQEITHTLLDSTDSLPRNICLKCAKKIKQSASFKKVIEDAHKALTRNLRKAEWSHFHKMSNSQSSEFAEVLDKLCEDMEEIIDDAEDDAFSIIETNTEETAPKPTTINNDIKSNSIPPVNKIKKVQAKQQISNVAPPAKNKKKPIVLHGKEFIEDLLKKQDFPKRIISKKELLQIPFTFLPQHDIKNIQHTKKATDSKNTDDAKKATDRKITEDAKKATDAKCTEDAKKSAENVKKNTEDAKRASEDAKKASEDAKKAAEDTKKAVEAHKADEYETIIIIAEEEEHEAPQQAPDEVTLPPHTLLQESPRNLDFENEIVQIEKECNEILNTTTATFDADNEKPVQCHKCQQRFTSPAILQRHLLYHSLDIIPLEPVTNKQNPVPNREPLNDSTVQTAPSSAIPKVATLQPPSEQKQTPGSNIPKVVKVQQQSGQKQMSIINVPMVVNIQLQSRPILKPITVNMPQKPSLIEMQTCQYCKEQMPMFHMKTHVKIKHKAELDVIRLAKRLARYTCPICKKPCKYNKTLKSHMRTHEQPKGRFVCEHCNAVFMKKSELTDHLHADHGVRMMSVCYICGKMYTAATMAMHIRTHTDTKTFKCTVEGCRAMLKYKSSLRDHLERIHGTEEIHMCEMCGKTFRARSSLVAHRRNHNAVKRYKCDICERRFALRCKYRAHFRAMHQGARHKCPVCPATFGYKESIKKHCGTYHPEHPLARISKNHRNYTTNPVLQKKFKCDICKKAFAYEYNVVKHKKLFHPFSDCDKMPGETEEVPAKMEDDFCLDEELLLQYDIIKMEHEYSHISD